MLDEFPDGGAYCPDCSGVILDTESGPYCGGKCRQPLADVLTRLVESAVSTMEIFAMANDLQSGLNAYYIADVSVPDPDLSLLHVAIEPVCEGCGGTIGMCSCCPDCTAENGGIMTPCRRILRNGFLITYDETSVHDNESLPWVVLESDGEVFAYCRTFEQATETADAPAAPFCIDCGLNHEDTEDCPADGPDDDDDAPLCRAPYCDVSDTVDESGYCYHCRSGMGTEDAVTLEDTSLGNWRSRVTDMNAAWRTAVLAYDGLSLGTAPASPYQLPAFCESGPRYRFIPAVKPRYAWVGNIIDTKTGEIAAQACDHPHASQLLASLNYWSDRQFKTRQPGPGPARFGWDSPMA